MVFRGGVQRISAGHHGRLWAISSRFLWGVTAVWGRCLVCLGAMMLIKEGRG